MSEDNSGAVAPDIETSVSQAISEVESELNAEDSSEGSAEGQEVDETSEDSIDEAEASGQISKKEAQVLKKKLKLKVDGQEIEEELDFNDEDGLKRHLQKSKAFDKRAKEHAEYKSQVDQLLQMLQQDPEGLLERMGLNVDELAEKRLTRKIEEMKKTPEQLEAEKMRKRLEELEKKEKEAQERAQRAELEKLKNEQAAKIESEIHEALENSKSILPKKNPQVLQRIAQAMVFAIKNGYTNVEPKDVIPFVEKQYKEEFSSILGNSSDDVLEMLASKDRLNAYRKAQVKAKAPSVQKPKIQDTGASRTKREEPKEEPIPLKSFFTLNPNKR